jgi:uncharacterized membrane protein YbhN (UPF0104 family)
MEHLRRRPLLATAIAYSLAMTAAVAIAGAWGFDSFTDVWAHIHAGWLALGITAELLTFPVYVLAYRTIALVHGGPRLALGVVLRLVVAGFGPFVAGGGFAMDKRALHAITEDERAATTRVLGLGALEWALLAPAAWVCAVALLVASDRRPLGSLLWPWALAVPVGFAVGLWLAGSTRRRRVERAAVPGAQALGRALHSVAILFTLGREPRRFWCAWLGSALYWVFDIAAFYGACAFIGLHINLPEVVVGYATGYALTRRSMPLGGAGITEALMTFSLHWVGQPIPAALAAVLVYRCFNFLLPTIPALAVRPAVEPLLLDGEPEAAGVASAQAA